jgi:SNF2 family DNA or RNA helicase
VVPKEVTFAEISGVVKKTERLEIIDEFKTGKVQVLFLTYGVGSEGHNLQNCKVEILLDRWWTQMSKDQAQGRVFRVGQKRNVEVTQLEMEDSIDQHVVKVAERKGRQQDELLKQQDRQRFP